MEWQSAEAKNKLDEVMTKALTTGPQRIASRDQVVVVLSEAEYLRLTGERRTLKDYLLTGPDLNGLESARDSTRMRDVDL